MSRINPENISVRDELNQILSERILVVDGAMGTALEALQPTTADFGGDQFEGCNEMLNLHAPQIVEQVYRSYIDAGADIISTNSFNGSPVVLAEYEIADQSRNLARRSAEIALNVIQNHSHGRRMFLMGSMGPGTKSIAVTGGITFDEVSEAYREYSSGLIEGGVDLLVLETMMDSLNLKAALQGIQQAQDQIGRRIPISVSVTIETTGTMLAGQNIEALYHSLAGFDLFSIGMNCATGPAMMTDHLRSLAELSRFPVSAWPNAGLPNDEGIYTESPQDFADVVGRFARDKFINIVGGCCGTTQAHIRAVKQAVDGVKPREFVTDRYLPALAGSEAILVEDDNRPVFVGERTNTIGSRKFKRLVRSEKWDEAAEIGREQVKKGAMVLDLCCADPERDEVPDYLNVMKPLLRKVRVPIMIDTTDPEVVEAALKNMQGKPAINSVNLEDGGGRLRRVAELSLKYGAALICGLIDDDPESGMAVTLERKMEVAEKIYRILKDEFSFPDQDIIFDPLVFPAGTGDPNYIGAAGHTREATKKIKQIYPDCLTILGISNVSFGLPLAGREVVNSVFLYDCTRAGLDLGIVNTERLKRYPSIPENEIRLAEDVLYKSDSTSISDFTAHFRTASVKGSEDEWQNLTVAEKLSRAVIEARKTGLLENLDEMLEGTEPLGIINGPLMEGMGTVGQLFGANKLIVAEVLESAEVMKAAVDYLQKFFPKGTRHRAKGKMVLATVKGDVHDIGKNLVDMIMANNGFDIVNLGIKIPPEKIIEAVRAENPDMIGLSGLLVRSAHQMVNTAADLTAAGISLPLMVGGAALTRKFTMTKIASAYGGSVFYASEAMDGLAIGNRIVDDALFPALKAEWDEIKEKIATKDQVKKVAAPAKVIPAVRIGWRETEVPAPPDYDQHIQRSLPVDEIYKLINPQMLYGKRLGVRGFAKRKKDASDEKLKKLFNQVNDVFEEAISDGVIAPRAIHRWFKVRPEDEQIRFENPDEGNAVLFDFPRQLAGERLSAVDWIRPGEQGGDNTTLFVTTAGGDSAPLAARMRNEGRLLASHILQALTLEIAEASAEWLHIQLRREWGFPDPPDCTLKDLFNTNYHGIRLSFGYPACPKIEDQIGLFLLLKPEQIGVELTEGCMMHPESSVSALVFHHPEGKYYSV